VVLFESPKRVGATMNDLLSACGDRPVALCRELTKLHQEVIRGRLSEVIEGIRGRDLKGEVVLVVGGAARQRPGGLDEAVRAAEDLVAGGARKREASRRAAAGSGVPATRVYQALVERSR